MLVDDVFNRVFTNPYESMFYYHPFKPKYYIDTGNWFPYVNTKHDNEGNFIVEASIPGLDKEDIKVSIKNSILHIEAESKEDSDRNIHYNQKFTIPQDINAEGISAEYKQGILKVKVPKIEKSNEEVNEVKVE